jgi:hypothetical protein
MATIKHKRSDVSGSVPAQADLTPGELALNTADGKLFTKKTDGTVVELTMPVVIDGGEILYDNLRGGLLGFWLFDSVVGSAADVSGNNVPLFEGAYAEKKQRLQPPDVLGPQDASLELSKRNFFYTQTDFPTRRTVAFWLRVVATAPFSGPEDPANTLLCFDSFAATTGPRIRLGTSGNIEWVNILAAGENPEIVTSGDSAVSSGWRHYAFVYDSAANTVAQYENGELVDTAAVTGALQAPGAGKLVIGLHNATPVQIDCLGIWNRPLSDVEIKQLFGPDDEATINIVQEELYSIAAPTTPQIDAEQFIRFNFSAPITTIAISVAGSTATLFPAFSADVTDYGVKTASATAGAAVTFTLTVNGVSFSAAGAVNKLIRVASGSQKYYIRLLPSDIQYGTVITPPGNGYVPGYYITTSRRDIIAENYNIVYNEYGLPIWYVQNAGTPHLAQHGNDRNEIGISRNGAGTRYAMTITNTSINTRPVEFLPTTRNGNSYQYNFGNHEFLDIKSPPSRRGNIVYNHFIAAPAAGSQALTDKSYGVYIQEQQPNGTIGWEWWTSDAFDQTTLARNASFFHMNSVDAHPVTGDMLLSCRQCSAIVCVDHTTKAVKWVIQGASQSWGNISQTASAATLATAQFLTLEDEPTLENGYEYLGPEGQHHARWCTHIEPLTPGNEIVSIFDNQVGFFPGSSNLPKTATSLAQNGTTVTATVTNHGYATGAFVRIAGATPSNLNGVYVITSTGTNTFTYVVASSAVVTATGTITAQRAQTYFPHSDDPRATARGVIYEIDLVNNRAIHRASVFAQYGTESYNGSGYLGSYHVALHDDGSYSHVLNFTQQHPQLVEYADGGNGCQPGAIILAIDFPGDLYRITKVPKDYFDLDFLRATAGKTITIVTQ